MDIEEKISAWAKKNNIIQHTVNRVTNTGIASPYSRESSCYELKFQKQGSKKYSWLYIYAGKIGFNFNLASFLRHAIDEADHYGGHETFNRWYAENEGGYLDKELGRKTLRALYTYEKRMYKQIVKIVGVDSFEEIIEQLEGE